MISININKAKTIAHEVRRQRRAEEFDPVDQAIASRFLALMQWR